jgi:isochorismate hydrolase
MAADARRRVSVLIAACNSMGHDIEGYLCAQCVADAVAQEHQRLREAVEIAMAKAYDNPSEYRRLIRAVFNGR